VVKLDITGELLAQIDAHRDLSASLAYDDASPARA